MAREKTICSYSKCNKVITKRNYKQHACCDSHRVLSNREKNGGSNPYSKKSQDLLSGVFDTVLKKGVPLAMNNSSSSAMLSGVATSLITSQAVPAVSKGIRNGTVKPIESAAGAALGFFVSGYFTDNALLKVLGALAGGFAANHFFQFTVTEVEQGSQAQKFLADPIDNDIALTAQGFVDKMIKDGIINTRDYRKIEIKTIDNLNPIYSNLFGNPSQDFYMMVHGRPGQGKTYWTVKFANDFNSNIGNVLYYAAEQNGTNAHFQTIQKKLKTSFDVHVHPERLTKDEMIQHFNKYALVIIDSVNVLNLSHQDLKEIRDNSTAATLVVLQSNKDGDFKGEQNWLHDVDISLNMENRKPIVTKSRFGGNPDFEQGKVISFK